MDMSFLDGLLGGVVGAELTHLVSGFIQQQGGLPALVTRFEQQGMGGVVQSWIGTGTNLPITPDQLHQVLGSDMVTHLAAKLGISPQQLTQKLSQILPPTVDKMTPDGVIVKAQ
jgi:uncharacterized protein YidB (DUF937 family)